MPSTLTNASQKLLLLLIALLHLAVQLLSTAIYLAKILPLSIVLYLVISKTAHIPIKLINALQKILLSLNAILYLAVLLLSTVIYLAKMSPLSIIPYLAISKT